MGKRGRLALVPFGGLGMALALTSVAFACTVFRGTLTVAGDRGGSVTTIGLRGGMIESVSPSGTAASANGGWVQVSAGTDGCCNRLPSTNPDGTVKTYEVRFFNGEGYDAHDHWVQDCMVGSAGVTLTSVHLNNKGQISEQLVSGSYKRVKQPITLGLGAGLTPNIAPQESAVCISEDSGAYGNQAPVTIV